MGIRINGEDVLVIYNGSQDVLAVYTNGQLIWPNKPVGSMSCFANGYWVDENPWTDNEPWMD